jgi:ATP dependent DNA ligase-like protein
MAFDLLYCDRRDITARPLRDRRARLEDVVAGSELVFRVRRLAPDGLEAWKQGGRARGYEGYLAKDERSVYEGGATRRWVKVKQKDWTVAEDGWRRRISVVAAGSLIAVLVPRLPEASALRYALDGEPADRAGRVLHRPPPVRRPGRRRRWAGRVDRVRLRGQDGAAGGRGR